MKDYRPLLPRIMWVLKGNGDWMCINDLAQTLKKNQMLMSGCLQMLRELGAIDHASKAAMDLYKWRCGTSFEELGKAASTSLAAVGDLDPADLQKEAGSVPSDPTPFVRRSELTVPVGDILEVLPPVRIVVSESKDPGGPETKESRSPEPKSKLDWGEGEVWIPPPISESTVPK